MRENIMKKILSVLLVLTMVLSLGLTFAASAADWEHPEMDVFADDRLPEANMEHPFDEIINKGTTPVEFELSNVKYNYTYNADGTSTTPTIIKKVDDKGNETVVETDGEEGATYKYYVSFPTVTVDGKMYVVVETWAQIASLARAGVGTQYTEGLNLVFKHDITPQVMVALASDDKLVTEKKLQYIFAPVTEGINNIPAMNAVGTDRVLTIDGNGYGLTNFSMNYVTDNGVRTDNKEGLFGSVGKNLTLQNIHVGTKAAPIAFAFKGESGLLTSWVAGGSVVTVDNMMLYMKGTGDGNGHMGALLGNKSNGGAADTTTVSNSVFAFEIVRSNHTGNHTSALGCEQSGVKITDSDFFCYVITGGGDNALVAANGNNEWTISDVNIYGYGFSTNNMSAFGGYTGANFTFENVTNYATMAGNGGGSIAGFVGNYGAAQTHTYKNCHNKGDIYQVGNAGWSFAGGFEGRAQGTVTMTDCTNTGNVYGVYCAGGFFAESLTGGGAKSFTNCSNGSANSFVSIQGGANVGGFIGSACSTKGFSFKDCSSYAAIIGTDNVGGFTGWTENVPVTIENCVSVLAAQGKDVAGFVAKSNGGQMDVNPTQAKDLTDANDADGNGIIDANEATKIIVTNSKTVVYVVASNNVAPLVGTYNQSVKVTEEDGTVKYITVRWNALDTDASVENASNVDGDGISASAIMDMAAIETLLGEKLANGINDVFIDYTAASTDDGNIVRVFATSAVLPNEYAGFTFSYTYTDENGVLTEAPERTFWSSEVYNGLNGLDYSYEDEIPATEEGAEPTYKTVYPFGEFNACKLAGSYVWALTFDDVPAGDVTITIKAFADDVTSETITIVLRDGNVYVAPVEGETTEG